MDEVSAVHILSQSMSLKWMGGPQGKVKLGEPEFERQFLGRATMPTRREP